jgi:hypothetical protein
MTLGIVFCDPIHRRARVIIYFQFVRKRYFKVGQYTLHTLTKDVTLYRSYVAFLRGKGYG